MVSPVQIRPASSSAHLWRHVARGGLELLRPVRYKCTDRAQVWDYSSPSGGQQLDNGRGAGYAESLRWDQESRPGSSRSSKARGNIGSRDQIGQPIVHRFSHRPSPLPTNHPTHHVPLRRFSTLSKSIKVLALESSADDSCAAIVDSDRKIWSNIIIKQLESNAKWGGIHPREAQLAHSVNLPQAIARVFSESGLSMDDIDVVAYTRGPGMPGCLHVCGTAAKALAAAHSKPILAVHHMQAHTLTPLLTEDDPPSFPFLTLLVSGGHTQIVLATAWDEYEIIADTLDSRVGNAVDRISRYLQLSARPDKGAGAILEDYAALPPLPPYDSDPIPPLPVPMMKLGESDRLLAFSFSGLTSHAERLIDALTSDSQIPYSREGGIPLKSPTSIGEDDFRLRVASSMVDEATKREVSRVFQDSIMGHIVQKIELCFKIHSIKLRSVTGLVMSGGVASNQHLRSRVSALLGRLSSKRGRIKLYYPPKALCTDNAAMIAWAGLIKLKAGYTNDGFELLTRPKWSLEDLYDGQ
ncbi:glycoprotease family-domain-containing protein [Kockovaella imperatae]|uniref:N(6)-L-threonylcarbamoyladenine synthase n=1 Tax=Kockovaella imperatae TaxID=4999 RepID=A0A1Y1UCV0_9TREE|nr:glycoprotease family-domain-containing protein [Kockovaella imperatae]ORX35346.1 glycoprotease family-domain-containing protein [Kockovaella imperatae]